MTINKHDYSLLVFTVLAVMWFTALDARAGDWACKARITFSGYDGSEPLTNFPALVIFGTNIADFFYNQFGSPATGGDLRFKNSNETVYLNHEIEEWNTGASSYVWVQIPELYGTNMSIWAYWGNPDETTPPVYATNGATWSEGYVAVWHLAGSPVGPILDSTSNGCHGTAQNMEEFDLQPGLVGGSFNFDGINEYIRLDTVLERPASSAFTVSAWARPLAPNNYEGVFCSTNGYGGDVLRVYTTDNNKPDMRFNGAPNYRFAYSIETNGVVWTHLALTRASSGTIKEYMNGSDATGGSYSQNTGLDIAYLARGHSDDSRDWSGGLDEIRVSSMVRSSDWLRACWLNQVSNGTFNTYGKVSWKRGAVLGIR